MSTERWLLGAVLLLSGFFLGSCDDHLYGSQEAFCRTEQPLTWENFGWKMMDENCNGCHSSFHTGDDRVGAPEGVDFDTWAGVVEHAEPIYRRSIESESMPPLGGVPPLKRAMLDEWLRCEVFPEAGVSL